MSVPKSVWGRSSLLLKMAGKMAYKELESRVQSSPLAKRIEQAQEMVQTLSQMKGAAMKVGQLLSLDAADIFPPEVVKILGQLQYQSESLPYKDIELILKSELGPERLSHLDHIDTKPLASASIGQVHRVRISGEELVFKVQYPGVADSIDSDINLLEKILSQMLFFSGKKISLKPLMEELKDVLKLETDYLQEAIFLKRYQENFKSDKRFHIPKPIPEFTTSKVLCLEYCEGMALREWLEKDHDQETLEMVATYALELFLKEFYEFGLVQTDPNFGNFLVRENPLSLVLLDFGSTKEYSPEFISKYKDLVRSAFLDDVEGLLKHTYEFKFMDPREPEEVKEKYLKMMKAIVEPFQLQGKFDFTDTEFMQKTKDLSWDFSQSLKYSPLPKDLVFLHRKLGGIFGLMKKCKAHIALRPYMEEALGL